MCVYRNSKLIKCNGEHLITPECVQSFEVPWRYLVEKRGRVLVTSKRQDKQVTKNLSKNPGATSTTALVLPVAPKIQKTVCFGTGRGKTALTVGALSELHY